MECRADAIRLDSQSGGHIGKDRKVSSAAGGNLSRMHKTEKTAKESRVNLMYSHLCDGTLDNGNFRAVWKNSKGERVALEFQGSQTVEFVIFEYNHLLSKMMRMTGIQELNRIQALITAAYADHLLTK